MKKITNEEAIEIFNQILEGAKLPQKSLELLPSGVIVARNRFGKIVDKWYIKEDADPIMMIRDICNMLIKERR